MLLLARVALPWQPNSLPAAHSTPINPRSGPSPFQSRSQAHFLFFSFPLRMIDIFSLILNEIIINLIAIISSIYVIYRKNPGLESFMFVASRNDFSFDQSRQINSQWLYVDGCMDSAETYTQSILYVHRAECQQYRRRRRSSLVHLAAGLDQHTHTKNGYPAHIHPK